MHGVRRGAQWFVGKPSVSPGSWGLQIRTEGGKEGQGSEDEVGRDHLGRQVVLIPVWPQY